MEGMNRSRKVLLTALLLIFQLGLACPSFTQDALETKPHNLDYWRRWVRTNNPNLDQPASEKLANQILRNEQQSQAVKRAFEKRDADEFRHLMQEPETRRHLDPNGAYLVHAVEAGEVELARAAPDVGLTQRLIKDRSWSPGSKESVLHIAAERLDLSMVNLLLDRGAEVNALDAIQQTPLLRSLISRRAIKYVQAPSGKQLMIEQTPASIAVSDRLLEAGAFIFATNQTWRPVNPLLLGRSDERPPQRDSELITTTLVEKLLAKNLTNAVSRLLTNRWVQTQQSYQGDTPLHVAIEHNLPAAAEFLIEQRTNLNTTNHVGWTPLHTALNARNATFVERLLSVGASVDSFANAALGQLDSLRQKIGLDPNLIHRRDGALRTTLHWAAVGDQRAIISWLVEHGADSSARDRHGETALHIAVALGNTNAVQSLLEHGADPNARNGRELSPMLLAAACGNITVLALLHRAGAQPDASLPSGSALQWAAYEGHLAAVKWLLDQDVPVNARNRAGQTALDLATLANRQDVIAELLRRGAPPSTNEVEATTALHLAAARGEVDQIRKFLDKGAPIDARDEKGQTALLLATERQSLPTMRLLIERGADLEIADDEGYTPLLKAATMEPRKGLLPAGDYPLLLRWIKKVPQARSWIATNLPTLIPTNQLITPFDYLLVRGANPEAVNTKGEGALHLVWTGGFMNPEPQPKIDGLIASLVHAGLNPDSTDRDGKTPLHRAASESGRWAKAWALLSAGADPNVHDNLGRTPLHDWVLSTFPDENVGMLLLTNRANINAQDHDGNTPLHLALYKTFPDPAGFLAAHGADVSLTNHSGRSALFLREERGTFVRQDESLRPPGTTSRNFQEAMTRGTKAEVERWLKTDPTLVNLVFTSQRTPLLIAEQRGDELLFELVQSYLARRSAPFPDDEPPVGTGTFPHRSKPKFGGPPEPLPGDLLAEALHGDTETVVTAVRTQPDLLKRFQGTETLLIAAAKNGHDDLVLALLKAGADAFWSDNLDRTALYYAWQLPTSSTATILQQNGAEQDVHAMAAAGHLKELVPLLEVHPDWINKVNPSGRALIHSAAFNGQIAVAEWLTNHGAKVEQRTEDYWHWTPLHCAVYAGQTKMFNWLLERGANVLTTDFLHKNLLHEAFLTQHLDAVDKLLSLKVPINAVDGNGSTPLDYLRFSRWHSEADILFRRLVSLGATNGPGPSAMMGRPIPTPATPGGHPVK
ncbi:hypothetical protein GC207_04105 [bacterium]|nr:hypothetical protein [bacterium]